MRLPGAAVQPIAQILKMRLDGSSARLLQGERQARHDDERLVHLHALARILARQAAAEHVADLLRADGDRP